jgi:glycosyltransferase involved in cell wall biosynthesis
MKVLMIAFGHPDNVLSLYKNIKSKIDINLVFVASGNRFTRGILNIDISSLKYGINSSEDSKTVIPEEIMNCIGRESEIRFIRTYDRKLVRDKYLRNLRVIRKAIKLLKNEGYDIIHFNGYSGFMSYMLFYFRKYKMIWTLHDYKQHSGEEKRTAYNMQKFYARSSIHIIQHYRNLSEQVINDYKLPENRVHQVYSGKFDIFNCFTPKTINSLDGEEYILFFGRISKYKGIDYLIRNFIKIQSKRGTKLVIAGSGKLWFDHDETYRDIMILNRYIETPELVYLLQNCRFVVVPYTDATHSATIMTAYAFNKPVVSSGVGGIMEVVEQNKTGIIVQPGNQDEFRSALESLIHDDDLLTRMSKNIQEYCCNSHISWQNVTEKLHHVYDKILSS